MNILLNLLPENKKLYLKERVRSRFVFSQMLMLLFFLGLYIVILTGAFFSLQYSETSFQDTTRQMELDANRKMLAESEAKFQEVNRKVDIVARLNQEHFHFTELLIKLEQALPPGVILSSVATKDYEVDFSGKAGDRNDIVLLEKNLNKESCFTAIDIPPSTWLSPKDIVFQIGFSVKKECIQ